MAQRRLFKNHFATVMVDAGKHQHSRHHPRSITHGPSHSLRVMAGMLPQSAFLKFILPVINIPAITHGIRVMAGAFILPTSTTITPTSASRHKFKNINTFRTDIPEYLTSGKQCVLVLCYKRDHLTTSHPLTLRISSIWTIPHGMIKKDLEVSTNDFLAGLRSQHRRVIDEIEQEVSILFLIASL
jgi:hypothetical protein